MWFTCYDLDIWFLHISPTSVPLPSVYIPMDVSMCYACIMCCDKLHGTVKSCVAAVCAFYGVSAPIKTIQPNKRWVLGDLYLCVQNDLCISFDRTWEKWVLVMRMLDWIKSVTCSWSVILKRDSCLVPAGFCMNFNRHTFWKSVQWSPILLDISAQ